MKKVGILTFHDQLNYGGVLQAFALRQTIDTLPSHKAEIIHLWHDTRNAALLGKEDNPNIPFFSRLRNRRKAKKRPYGRQAFTQRRLKTKALIEKELQISSRTYRKGSELKRLPWYDTVVVGSDQVWNPFLIPTGAPEKNAFLGVSLPPNQRRVAYAASFGVSELPTEYYPAYCKYLQTFAHVTMREQSGAALYAKITGATEPEVVLDPTLLLSASDWHTIVADRKRPTTPYLVCYWIGDLTIESRDWLASLSDAYQMPVLLLMSHLLPINLDVPGNVIPCYDADPFDFIALIEGCEGIVTNSFHGLCFAANFGKKAGFFRPINGTSSRIENFLKRYQVQAILHSSEGFLKGELSLNEFKMVSLNAIRALLDADVRQSITLLSKMLS